MNIRHNEGTLSLQRTRAIRAISGTILVVIAIKARPVLICTLVPILIAEMPANWWSLLDGSCGSVRHGVLARPGVDVAGQIQTGIFAKHDNTIDSNQDYEMRDIERLNAIEETNIRENAEGRKRSCLKDSTSEIT